MPKPVTDLDNLPDFDLDVHPELTREDGSPLITDEDIADWWATSEEDT